MVALSDMEQRNTNAPRFQQTIIEFCVLKNVVRVFTGEKKEAAVTKDLGDWKAPFSVILERWMCNVFTQIYTKLFIALKLVAKVVHCLFVDIYLVTVDKSK